MRCGDCAYEDGPLRVRDDDCVVHLSAPSIYAAALESLDLQEGDSFLNVGSGTGYLSALAATILTAKSIHHCVERCAVLADRSRSRLQEFRNVKVHVASAFDLDLQRSLRFDKIYVGAGAQAEDLTFLAKLLKRPHGRLVGPFEQQQQQRANDDDLEDFPRFRRHRPQSLLCATFPSDDDDEDLLPEQQQESNDHHRHSRGEEDDEEEEGEEEETRVDVSHGLRLREIMAVQFTPLRRDSAAKKLALKGPIWGVDAPELFPPAFQLLVALLNRSDSTQRLPWHVWESTVFPYLAHDDVLEQTTPLFFDKK